MRLVVADTGPIHYLILIGNIGVLPRLFERVVLPGTVLSELSHERVPASVRLWAGAVPAWLEVAAAPDATFSAGVHKGEAAAISLAALLRADLVLMDDRKGVAAVERQGLKVAGTLGVLNMAAERGLINFAQSVSALKLTTFRMPLDLMNELLRKDKKFGEV